MEPELSKIISKIRTLWKRFASKEYRDAYVSVHISEHLAAQIFALREHRGWTQSELAEKANMKQPRISKLEESCNGVSVSTLKKIAAALDVALTVKFVPFSSIVEDSTCHRVDARVPSFLQDVVPITKAFLFNAPISQASTNNSAMTAFSTADRMNDYAQVATLPLSQPVKGKTFYAH
jgi:transcriptional regulator with XRE-family HTH domain